MKMIYELEFHFNIERILETTKPLIGIPLYKKKTRRVNDRRCADQVKHQDAIEQV